MFYNTVNFQPGTFRILFFRGIQTLQMRLSRKACFWWTQLLRPFCRAADEVTYGTAKKKRPGYLVGNLVATNWPIEKALHAIGYNQIPTK